MAPLDQSLPSSSKPRPPQVEIEPYGADLPKASAKKAVTNPVAETEDNKVGDNIQYFYSEEYKRRWSSDSTRRRRRTDRRVIKKVRFSLDNLRVQSAYSPSNQFRFPTKRELQEWAVLRPRKRNHIEEKTPMEANPTTKKKKNKRKKKKKKNEDEDFTPDLQGKVINNTEQKSVNENEAVDKQLGEERRVNIVFNDPNLGFLLQPVAGRYKAMVAQVTKHLMETEKLYPGMRVCSIENKPISPSCSLADVQAMIEQLKTPTLIGFVDVYKHRCKICLRGFLKHDQMALHMAEHKQQQPPEVEQIDQRKRWLMNLQMQNPLMYQQYVIQHQISRVQAHIETIKSNPALQTQRLQAEAHIDLLKNQLISLSHQQRTSMLQKQQGPGPRNQGQAASFQGISEMSPTENIALAATTARSNSQLTNTSRTADVSSTAQLQKANSEQASNATNINNTSVGHLEGQPTNKEDAREDRNIQIALSQLAALKQIYTRSPQTAIAQLAGLLQMAEKNEVAVSQLRNLQEAAKRDAELAGLFSNLQKTAFSVLQRHIARQKVSKENAPQLQGPSNVQALKRNQKKPKQN